MQSTHPPKEADPLDVFAIETILATRADHRTPPLAHDPASQPAAPQVHVAPEVSVAAPAPQVEPTFRATDIRDVQVENNRPDEIRVDDLKPLGERPTSKWAKRVVMTLARPVRRDRRRRMAALWRPGQGDGGELGAAIRACYLGSL